MLTGLCQTMICSELTTALLAESASKYIFCPGKIVKGFGPQWNPKLNTTLDNPGIDIAANSTTPVKSVFDGLVTTITFISGYGTTVIIDHDDGYFTVFTHLENLLINENMIVKEGQEIGFVSNNNIIHFEIWGNNQKLNPTQWIKNGYK